MLTILNMVESHLLIIFQMVATVLSNALGTMVSLVSLTGSLGESLGFISGFGMTGLAVSVIVLAAVLFFLFKFFLKSAKTIVLLFAAGVVILLLLFI